MNAQADLNLRRAYMSEGSFSDIVAQIIYIQIYMYLKIKNCLYRLFDAAVVIFIPRHQ